jgi:ABC-type phosphonate transport system ATPase subunit
MLCKAGCTVRPIDCAIAEARPTPCGSFPPTLQVMVVGQTGLGKSTLINTLFASHLIDSKGRVDAFEQPRSTTEIHPVSHREYRSEQQLGERWS